MLQQLIKKARERIGFGLPRDGRPGPADPILRLTKYYGELLRLEQQIESHAERAPYPHVAEKLRRIAREKRELASTMRGKIPALEKYAGEPPSTIKSGKNHWERMVQDLEDQKALDEGLTGPGETLAGHDPELSRVLLDIVAAQASHKDDFRDLIARSDPQAYQY